MSYPNIFIFNPTSDMAIANSLSSFHPNKQLVRFQEDLSYLPFVFASEDDVVLVSDYEDLEHISQLYEQGFTIPGQVLQKEVLLENQKIFADIHTFLPWGWAPNIYHQLKQIKTIDCEQFWSFSPLEWNNDIRYFYSRSFALDILNAIKQSTNKPSIYIDEHFFPKCLTDWTDVSSYLKQYQQIVLKEPWSSSGRGLMFLLDSDIPVNIQERVKQVIKKQKYIMLEPVLNKKIDFSLHFDLSSNQVDYVGATYFFTNGKGQYNGHFLNTMPDCEEISKDFFQQHLPQLIKDVTNAIRSSALFGQYTGSLGVDAMLVKEGGELLFQPCLEINLRYSMGKVALALEKVIHPDSFGKFFIHNNKNQTYASFMKEQDTSYQMLDNRLAKGLIPITAPKGKCFGAYMEINHPDFS